MISPNAQRGRPFLGEVTFLQYYISKKQKYDTNQLTRIKIYYCSKKYKKILEKTKAEK